MNNFFQTHEINSKTLKDILFKRANKEFEFLLVDVRNADEYQNSCIKGTDLLLPISTWHMNLDKLYKLKDKNIIIYCNSGSRTFQAIIILKNLGFKNFAHLDFGISNFNGEIIKNAQIPNKEI